MVVFALAFSNNGRHLASGGFDNTLLIWKVEDMTIFISINLENNLVSIVYSPDDSFLIVSQEQEFTQVFSTNNLLKYEENVRDSKGKKNDIISVA